MFLSIIIGVMSGIISGMGIGGGTILIPALTMFLGISQQVAQGINLLYFIPTALVALRVHKKNGALEIKLACPIILFGVVGALCGSFVAVRLTSHTLRRLFGIFLIFMGLSESRKGFQKDKK